MKLSAALLALLLPLSAGAGAPADPIVAEATKKNVFVFAEFVSRTCPVCREMAPIVAAALERHRSVVHQVYDADRDLALSDKYEVRCVPVYVVVDPKGTVRFNEVGTRTAEELDEILKAAGARRR